ncbi:prolyl oligopeptidase family serine peptidase [Flavobacterium sp. D33]|nr:prolyl oligopeptidase family serine peptidase [Flavobacterium selenitireducens]
MAQQTAQKFVLETKYLLYLPDGYESDTTRNWPLMIFLHGSGESGEDVDKVKVNGPPKLIEQGKKFPMIVISPQAPKAEGFKPEILKKMLDDLKSKYRVDADRVYLTGLSMGGFGTFEFAGRFPDEFAAIAPVCGGGDPTKAYRLRHIPTWIFHGAKDDVVLPIESQRMADSLSRFSKNVRLTMYPEANHNSWDVTYANDSLYSWMLQQKKFRYAGTIADAGRLKKLQGTFRNTQGNSLVVFFADDALWIRGESDEEKTELKPFSSDGFFIVEDRFIELYFHLDKKGKALSFSLDDAEGRTKFTKVKNRKKSD